MLIFQDNETKVYLTNNLLLILEGDSIIKEMYIKEKCMVDDAIIEFRERKQKSNKLVAVK